jgi:PmbA protein
MSQTTVDDLQAIADAIVAEARPGEQIQAHVSRGRETDIRVYQGNVEHFVSAQSQGVSVLVIIDGRTGTSHAGRLDEESWREALAEARENALLGSVDEWAGLAEPDGVPIKKQQLWNDELDSFEVARKIDIAKELEQLAVTSDARVRIDDANYADGAQEEAFATTKGIRSSGRSNSSYASVSVLADDNGETQTGWSYS